MVDVSVVLWTGLLGNVLAALIALGGVYLGGLRTARIEAAKRYEERVMRREAQQLQTFREALADLSRLNVAIIDLTSWRQAAPEEFEPSPEAAEAAREAVRQAFYALSALELVGDEQVADAYKQAMRPLMDGQDIATMEDRWNLEEYRRLQDLARSRQQKFVQIARARLSHLAEVDRRSSA